MIQQGISEKVALSVQYTSSFVSAFVIAYIRSWRLALALTSIFPCIAIAFGVMEKFASGYLQTSLTQVAESGTIAEEVISTIRTAHAFGTQKTLANLYDSHIKKSHTADSKAAIFQGMGNAAFFFVIYSAYGLAFNFGTTLLIHGHGGVGIIVNVFLAIMFASVSLAMLTGDMEGKHIPIY